MRPRRSSESWSGRLKALLTVMTDTPITSAMSFIVTLLIRLTSLVVDSMVFYNVTVRNRGSTITIKNRGQ